MSSTTRATAVPGVVILFPERHPSNVSRQWVLWEMGRRCFRGAERNDVLSKQFTVISYRHFHFVSFLGILLVPSFSFLEKGLGVYCVLYESHYSGSWERRGLVFVKTMYYYFLSSFLFGYAVWVFLWGISLGYLSLISFLGTSSGYLILGKGHGLMFCHSHVLLLLLSFHSPITPSLHTFRL